MNITKQDNIYQIEESGKILATFKTYRNQHHLRNCYIQFDLNDNDNDKMSDASIFQKIADEKKCPLQVMIASSETQKVVFLKDHGFKKVRVCYELEVEKDDLFVTEPFQEIKILRANRGDADYLSCCEMLFEYYQVTHEAINPLTSPFEEFIELIPDEVLYSKDNDIIQHAAFVEDDEIAYVSSIDEQTFARFALTVVNILFEVYPSIIFEADNTDWVAMTLKNLFNVESTVTFDTWIYESVGN